MVMHSHLHYTQTGRLLEFILESDCIRIPNSLVNNAFKMNTNLNGKISQDSTKY